MQSVNEVQPVCIILQKKENSTKTLTWKLVPDPFAKN